MPEPSQELSQEQSHEQSQERRLLCNTVEFVDVSKKETYLSLHIVLHTHKLKTIQSCVITHVLRNSIMLAFDHSQSAQEVKQHTH